MLGIIANPGSGKDIRRLISGASVFDNQEKKNIVRRVVLGAVAVGENSVSYFADGHGIARTAIEEAGEDFNSRPVDVELTVSALDSKSAARRMREEGCGALVILGGDGTSRAVALGWQDAPVVAVSTGTNNVFPTMVEGTLAGMAAGLISTGRLSLNGLATNSKLIHLEIDGEPPDLALIDAALIAGPFVGARAVWNPDDVRCAVLTRAEPASVGISSIGALISPLSADEDEGLFLELGSGGAEVTAPIAPGLMPSVPVRRLRRTALGERVRITGPGVLALDGERERRLQEDQVAELRVERDGLKVIDVEKTLTAAACARILVEGDLDGN